MDEAERKRVIGIYISKCAKLAKKDQQKSDAISRRADFVNEFGSANYFAEWWSETFNKQKGRCYYCDTPIADILKLIDNGRLRTRNSRGPRGKDDRSLNGRGRNLEVDCKNPDDGYVRDNCVLACMYCNNDKSDIFTCEEYREFFGENRQRYFQHLLAAIEAST